ncbi:ABC transporter ATP-binding protein [Alkalicoccus urumqiensis]|uniref:Molybdenum ABC transporter ATP-binding protein n=1 Tax=Alkalicoccus urumqiensis TaxID=1548213 RepID=A0A2P6MJZ6_ALKUR|nr:ABC transporter ATP-binding protein [Alkalicoccus urumqiensis]PRO66607.1 molybdenum ABC transporter ATP-binding protein [Alkalicoccus urumqiensis]
MREHPVINLQDVTVQRDGKALIKDINWQVNPGEHWGVLGLNGSGKTTLLKVVAGMMWPRAGSGPVDILGNRYGKTYMPDVKKKIGWVSQAVDQQYQAHSQTSGLDIVLSGRHASVGLYEPITEEDIKRAQALLERFRIAHLEDAPLSQYSQGERKKALLARAWMAEPELLILDEPCSGLDVYSREELLDTLEESTRESGGPTLLYVTHHLEEVIPSITSALLMKEGRIAASGKKEEVLTEEKLSSAFKLPLRIQWESGRPWARVQKAGKHSY